METGAKTKKIPRIVNIISVVIIVAIAVGIYFIRQDNKKIIKEGIRVTATILDLYKEGTRKNMKYYMKVSMFLEGEKITPPKNADTANQTEATKIVDAIFDKNAQDRKVGDFQMVTISVGILSYDKHKVGDKVIVAYLKEKPEEVLLVEEYE